MPTSALATWPYVLHLIETIDPKPQSLLDVGPGHGKASVLAREYLNHPPHIIDAVEAWEPYVDAFDLRALYDRVYVADVMTLSESTLCSYDVVLMADVIEHLAKPDALALLDRISGRVVVSTPVEFFHNGDGLPWTETHRSHWAVADFGDRVEVDASIDSLGCLLVRLAPLT